MQSKIEKNFKYEGLGFPVILNRVKLVKVGKEFHPLIDVVKISDLTIRSLVMTKSRLTGNQIRFIRKYLSMSLREFSKIVNETHMAVKKWEDFQNQITKMDPNIELVLRLKISALLKKKEAKKISQCEHEFFNEFTALDKIISNGKITESARINLEYL